MFSFTTPCMRWKLIGATKGQYGWPGFIAPYRKRYLHMFIKWTKDYTGVTYIGGAPYGAPPVVHQQLFVLDRLTGALVSPPTFGDSQTGYYPFPYGADLSLDSGSTWEVSETFYRHTVPLPLPPLVGNAHIIIEVTLSEQYTDGMLEADADALIATIDPNTVAWNTLVTTHYVEVSDIGDVASELPAQVTYPNNYGGPIPQLRAAAWYSYGYGQVGQENWYPNGYMKLIGYVAMAGNFCEKTFIIQADQPQPILNQGCLSGTGSCGAIPFKVVPPKLVPGQLAYVLVTPNCVCGT